MCQHISHLVRKLAICIGENKNEDQLRGNREAGNREADQRIVFATRKVLPLFFLNPKFQASSCILWLYSPVCIGPVPKPHFWFSYAAAHMVSIHLMD